MYWFQLTNIEKLVYFKNNFGDPAYTPISKRQHTSNASGFVFYFNTVYIPVNGSNDFKVMYLDWI